MSTIGHVLFCQFIYQRIKMYKIPNPYIPRLLEIKIHKMAMLQILLTVKGSVIAFLQKNEGYMRRDKYQCQLRFVPFAR